MMGPRRRSQLFVLFFFRSAYVVAGAASAHLRQAKALFPVGPEASSLKVPDCTCGCCHVTYRTPDEMGQGGTVFLKCALDEVQSQGKAIQTKKDLNGVVTTSKLSCQESCVDPDKEQSSKSNSTETAGVAGMDVAGESTASPIDYNRYCFYNCRPYDFTVGNICVSLTPEQKKLLPDGVDPAVHPQVTDPHIQKAWAQATGASPKPTEAPKVTSTTLPCEKQNPCAYNMMKESIKNATEAAAIAEANANQAADIAASAGKR